MARLRGIISALLRRRRRSWRYVSGRRRGLSLALFAGLFVLLWGWWHLTNDQRVERQAEAYLCRLTGGQVRIHSARFRLFEGIRLEGVRIFFTEAGQERDLLAARQVWLEYRPLSLLRTGKLRATRVLCVEPVLTLTEDIDTGRWNFQRLSGPQRPAQDGDLRVGELPVIQLRDGRVRRVDVVDGLLVPVGQERINASALPDETGLPVYELTIESIGPEGQSAGVGQGTLRMDTLELSLNGYTPFQSLDVVLSHRLRQWRDRFGVQGELRVELEGSPRGGQRHVVSLSGVSMALPPEAGGLALRDIQGRLTLTAEGIRIDEIVGQLPQADGAAFELGGHIDGYDAESPFEITLHTRALRFPLQPQPGTELGSLLARLDEELAPAGAAALEARLRRGRGGPIEVSGQVTLAGLDLTPRAFPYRLEGARGQVLFRDGHVELRDLRARHGRASLRLSGRLEGQAGGTGSAELSFSAQALPFDAALRDALPASAQRAWDMFAPGGQGDIEAAIRHADGEPWSAGWSSDVLVRLDGRASMTFRHFAYRVEGITGRLRFHGGDVEIDDMQGRHGPASVRVSGQVRNVEGRTHVDVRVRAADVPLDEALASALPEEARPHYEAFGLSGRGDMTGRFRWPGQNPLDWEFSATAKDVSANYAGFPYPLENIFGVLHFNPREVRVERLTGRRGDARLTVTGAVGVTAGAGLALAFDAAEVSFDETLRAALPDELASLWDRLNPSGPADLQLALRRDSASAPFDYELHLRPRGMTLAYDALPVTLRGVRGLVHATPGRVELSPLLAGDEDAPVRMEGTVVTDAAGTSARMTGLARGLAIDEPLLAALPEPLAGLRGALRPGGLCDLTVRQWTWHQPTPPATAPASTQPAEPPAAQWRFDGEIALREARLALADGGATVTGRLDGQLWGAGPAAPLGVEAALAIDTLRMGPRELTVGAGHVRKEPASPLVQIYDLTANAYGGRAAGELELHVAPAVRFGLSLAVEGIHLDDLLNAGSDDEQDRVKGSGRLAGRLQMTGELGRPASRQATGVLQITEGRIYRLPVLVGLLSPILLQLPLDNSFESGQVHYSLQGDRVQLDEIYLAGASLSLLGRGELDLASEQIDLTFLSGPPRRVPAGLRLLGELVNTTTQGLLEFRLTGTLREPKATSVPLDNLDALIRELRP